MSDEKNSGKAAEKVPARVAGEAGMIQFDSIGSQMTELEAVPAAAIASAQREVESSVVLAKRFPRNLDVSYQSIVRACKRPTFADRAQYRFPRGKKQDSSGNWVQNYVQGPSVYLARELAKAWGNIRFGIRILQDDDDTRTVEGWAWDLESNLHNSTPSTFRKLQQRKVGKGPEAKTEWVVPDERDLRELTNKHGSICVRNALLALIPADVVEDCMRIAASTLEANAKADPDAQRKAVLIAFGELNVTAEALEELIGCPVVRASPAQIVELKGFYQAIRDGQTTIDQLLAAIREERAEKETKGRGAVPIGSKVAESKSAKLNPRTVQELERELSAAGVDLAKVDEVLMPIFGVETLAAVPAGGEERIRAWIKSKQSS